MDTAGTGDVEAHEASSERTPAKHDEDGDSSSNEDEAAATPSNAPPLAVLGTPRDESDAAKTTQETEGNFPQDPVLTPRPQPRATPEVITPVSRRPGKEPADPDDRIPCEWLISKADQDLQRMVSDYLVFPDIERGVAHLRPEDLLAHSGVHLTKVISFELC